MGLKKKSLINTNGNSDLSLLIPLVILLIGLTSIAFVIPKLSTAQIFGLTAGIIIFLISFASTYFALFILIFSMLLSPEFLVGGATSGATLGRGVTLRIDDLLLIVITLSWLAKMAINKDFGLFLRTPLNKPIAYYILACLISTLLGSLFAAVNLVTGIFFVLKYFEYMVIYFMVVNFLKTKKQAEYYIWALLITCAIVSIIAMYQIPQGGRVSAPFEGKTGEPNTLGGYLVFMISLTLGLFLTSPSFRNQLIYAGLVILFFIPLFYTQSRSSYLAMIPSILVFLLFSQKRQWIIFAIVLISIAIPFLTPEVAKERISYTFTQGKNRNDTIAIGGVKLDTSTTARLNSWKEASQDWINHPIFGYGITGYGFVDAQYMRVITETGILGLLTYILLLTSLYKRVYEIFKSTKDRFEEGISMGFMAGYTGLLVHAIGANTFIIVRIMEPFWFITAIVFSLESLKGEALQISSSELSEAATK